jgi:dimethylhistidine N-methyltransferase
MNAMTTLEALSPLALDVRESLAVDGQKRLSSQWLYDSVGSALFEAITELEQYGLTRADERLLQEHADDIAAAFPDRLLVVELGSGSGRKTRRLLEAIAARQGPTRYFPIDVSAAALAACTKELAGVADVRSIQAEYLEGLTQVLRKRGSESVLLLFLGSTIGNFDPEAAEAFLRSVRGFLSAGDGLLIGADLVKPMDRMLVAYDDPVGVTAAFNRNVLARINRELGADFNVRSFVHEARYDPMTQRIEMHLKATRTQRVHIPGADVVIDIAAGETIWTESSYKFQLEDLHALAARTWFEPRAWWVDEEWPFAECLWLTA